MDFSTGFETLSYNTLCIQSKYTIHYALYYNYNLFSDIMFSIGMTVLCSQLQCLQSAGPLNDVGNSENPPLEMGGFKLGLRGISICL